MTTMAARIRTGGNGNGMTQLLLANRQGQPLDARNTHVVAGLDAVARYRAPDLSVRAHAAGQSRLHRADRLSRLVQQAFHPGDGRTPLRLDGEPDQEGGDGTKP